MRVVTVEIEIPDGAILGPAMVITYLMPTGSKDDDPDSVYAEIHSSARYNSDADPIDNGAAWLKSMVNALTIGMHGSGRES